LASNHSSNPATACSISCNLCDGTDVEQIRSKDRDGNPLRSVICHDCGLVWTDPRPTPEQVRAFYASEYRLDFKGTYQPKLKHTFRSGKVAMDRFSRMRQVLPKDARILDVGAGGGEVVYVLRALGFDASGLEPNEGYARYAAETLGLPVRQGFHQDELVEAQSQDAITMFHMVEHLENPLATLRNVHRWLRPGGVLVVEVPNVEAVCQQPHSQFHRGHLYHFNFATLEKLGERAGFNAIERHASADNGNIMVIFRKREVAAVGPWRVPGNCQRVTAILRGHTALTHAFNAQFYLRPWRKLANGLAEKRAVRRFGNARALLDAAVTQGPDQRRTP